MVGFDTQAGPFLRDHSDLVLPFALANATSAAFWYAVLETKLGLDGMAGAFHAEKVPVRGGEGACCV